MASYMFDNKDLGIGKLEVHGLLESLIDGGKTVSSVMKTCRDKRIAWLGNIINFDSNQLNETLASINNQPSLCYVPIQAESVTMRRQTDIGNTMLISQADQNKDYITDNAAPRPRTWTVQGYLKVLSPEVETGILIKPTLQIQRIILDVASESRRTVPFKTEDGEVVQVLIQDLQIGGIPKGNNVKTISVTVQEVKILTNTVIAGKTLSGAASHSIFSKTALNYGKNNALVSGVMNTVSALL